MRLQLVANVRREQSKLDGLLANVCERSRTLALIERRAVVISGLELGQLPRFSISFTFLNLGNLSINTQVTKTSCIYTLYSFDNEFLPGRSDVQYNLYSETN